MEISHGKILCCTREKCNQISAISLSWLPRALILWKALGISSCLILKISRVLFLRSSREFILQNSGSLNPWTTRDKMQEEAQCVFLGNTTRWSCIFNQENQMPVFHKSLLHPFSGFVCWVILCIDPIYWIFKILLFLVVKPFNICSV